MIAVLEGFHHNGDQNAEGSPGGAGGERQQAADEEDHSRQKIHEPGGRIFDDFRHKGSGGKIVCHGFQRPGKGQDQDGRNHGFKAFGQTVHAFSEGHDPADQKQDNGDHQGKEGAKHQSHGSVASGKGFRQAGSGEESSGVQHAPNAADNEADNRNQQIDDASIGIIIFGAIGVIGTFRVVKRSPFRALRS